MSYRPRYAINLIPVLFLGSILATGLAASSVWFVFLIGAVVWVFIFHTREFLISTSRVIPAMLAMLLLFIYAQLFATSDRVTASPWNIISWTLIIIVSSFCYEAYGYEYYLEGFRIILVILVACSLFGIFEWVTHYNPLVRVFGHILGSWRMGSGSYRCSSIFTHPIPFAHCLLIGMVIDRHLCVDGFMRFVTATMLLLALIGTQTRSAFIILGVWVFVLVFNFLFSKRNHKIPVFIIVIFPFVVAATTIFFTSGTGLNMINQFILRFQQLSMDDLSVAQRLGGINFILDVFTSSGVFKMLFGFGFSMSNAYMSATTIQIEGFTTVDNYWITLLFDFGVVPTITIAILLISAIRRGASSRNELPKAVAEVLSVSTLYAFFYSFTMWKVITTLCLICITFLHLYSDTEPDNEVSAILMECDD